MNKKDFAIFAGLGLFIYLLWNRRQPQQPERELDLSICRELDGYRYCSDGTIEPIYTIQ